MKKHLILVSVLSMSMILITSCKKFLNDYLDKAPESGLTEDVVFTKYANFKLFFDALYSGQKYYNAGWRDTWNYRSCTPLYMDTWDQKYCLNSTTDAIDQGRYMEGHAWKSGNMSETIIAKLCYDGSRRPVLGACLDDIRICNIALAKDNVTGLRDNIARITDITPKENDQVVKDDFRAQAFFMRAYFHFTLYRLWGPFPYLDYVMGPYDATWDLARMEKNDYLNRIVQDIDSAYKYFVRCDKVRRDPMPGVSGSLIYSAYEMYRPNGMAALAFKSRVLLYAASPFNNKNGTADWEKAAVAAWDAIQLAESKGVIVLPLLDPVSGIDRHLNYYGKDVCEESIWTRTYGNQNWNWGGGSGAVATLFDGVMMAHTSSSGIHPTQNWVDKYETITGRPLNTPDDRDSAIAHGDYNEKAPFDNRDPRLATDVIYNQSPCQGWTNNKAQIYMNVNGTPSELLVTAWPGRSYTGYLIRKIWANNSTNNQGVSAIWSDPIFRLTELYLSYGEAANEAYGPNGSAPGATYTALGAINFIRSKRGMPNVRAEYTSSKDLLRPRIQNERDVEMGFEAQAYYDDIRRWMILPDVMRGPEIAMIPQKTNDLVNYPSGFIYARTPLPADRQPTWEEGMYFLPFLNADVLKMKNFLPNTVW
jgi:hypothetical protein